MVRHTLQLMRKTFRSVHSSSSFLFVIYVCRMDTVQHAWCRMRMLEYEMRMLYGTAESTHKK